jgi:hypothetical protein
MGVRWCPQWTAVGDRRWREGSLHRGCSTPRARLPRTRLLRRAPVVISTLPVVRTTDGACALGSLHVSACVVGGGWHISTGVGLNPGPLCARDGLAHGEGVRSFAARIDARQRALLGAPLPRSIRTSMPCPSCAWPVDGKAGPSPAPASPKCGPCDFNHTVAQTARIKLNAVIARIPRQSLRRTTPTQHFAATVRPILAHTLSESSDFPMCTPCT